ncbi:Hypothetical predicted protein, partial [Olea europaea subsp. europaea]
MALIKELPVMNAQVDESSLSPEESPAMDMNAPQDDGRKETFVWPDPAVLLLLEVYREREEEFTAAIDSVFGEKAWVAPPAIASSDGPHIPASACSSGSSRSSSGPSEMATDKEPKPKTRRVETMLETFISDVKEDKQKATEEREKRRAET